MADISRLSRLLNGVVRGVDISVNTLVMSSLKLSTTELTKTILDKLILINNAADADGTFDSQYADIAHVSDTANPHSVSKAQVLSGDLIVNADVDAGAAIVESKLSLDYSTSTLNTNISNHISDVANPHSITKAQVLSGDLIVNADIDNAAAIVESKLSLDYNTSTLNTNISNHIADVANPHSVTKDQVLSGDLIDNDDVSATAAIAESKLSLDYSTSTLNSDIVSAQATADAALPKAGGTMSGDIAMGGSKITGLADGVNNNDAINLSQLNAALGGITFKETLLKFDQLFDDTGTDNGGIAAANVLVLSANLQAGDTITLNDGSSTESYVADTDFSIGASINDTIANLETAIDGGAIAISAIAESLDSIDPTNNVLVVIANSAANNVTRVYGDSGAAARVSILPTSKLYEGVAADLVAIPTSDPGSTNFGFNRIQSNLVNNETHYCRDCDGQFTWNSDEEEWNLTGASSVPLATTDTPGKVQIGDGIAVAGGIISADVDDSTIEVSGTSPDKKLQLKDLGITNAKVAAGAAIAESKLSLDYSTSTLNTNIGNHISDTSNPHSVAKAQVLSGDLIVNADIDVSAAIVESKLSLDYSTSTLNTNISNHIADTSNPHSVTKSQVLSGDLIVNADVDGSAAIAESKLALDYSTSSLNSSISSAQSQIDAHEDGTANKHDASEIDVETAGNYTTVADLETNLSALDTQIKSNADSIAALSEVEVLSENMVAGESFTQDTLIAVRSYLGAETVGRVYKGDIDASSSDNFYAIGLVYPSAAKSAGDNIQVIKAGRMNIPSHGYSAGPLYMDTNGVITKTAPSSANEAVVLLGFVIDANYIEVKIQYMGVN